MEPNTDLLAAIAELRQRYPHWRFGQLIVNIVGWADQEIWDVDDQQLLESARMHLEQLSSRSQQPASQAIASPDRGPHPVGRRP